MAQTITAVNNPHIEHGILIDLTLPDPTTGDAVLYRISNCYTNVTYNGHTYTALGGFLQVSDVQGDLQSTNNDITVAMSAIPPEYIEAVMQQEIKGGVIRIYRVFFDSVTQLALENQVFLRFDGIINNYAIQEDVNTGSSFLPEITYTIAVTCSSILSILEHRVSGRRTNRYSYRTYYPEANITASIANDPAMDRVVALKAATFDFGKKVNG